MFISQELDAIMHRIIHFLPSQAPLKDFIHHNTLHAFQERKFDQALNDASKFYGYQTYLQLSEYRKLYKAGKIKDAYLFRGIHSTDINSWRNSLWSESYDENISSELGRLRATWKSEYKIDLDSLVFPLLFRITLSYLDQGIASWAFPIESDGFIASIRKLEDENRISLFKKSRAKSLLLNKDTTLDYLLNLVVGDKTFFERYLFDQQFAHPGYAGMVAVLQEHSYHLVEERKIELSEFVFLELLLEIDALDYYFGEVWSPISFKANTIQPQLSFSFEIDELQLIKKCWQEAYELTYYDEVLMGINNNSINQFLDPSIQVVFCIDDRSCSMRRYIELVDPEAETFGTAGFFNLEFYFQPAHSELRMKLCPAPLSPKYLIKEQIEIQEKDKEYHFNDGVNSFFLGWILTQTFGFISGIKLFSSIFFPKSNKVAVSSKRHMYQDSKLMYEFNGYYTNDGLQIGFTIEEMADRLFYLLMSMGLKETFASLVYFVGHGSSSANNTHYAGYDCGACSGRPGSVNARVMAQIANRKDVREILSQKGLHIPDSTHFIGVLHDTCKDEMVYYDVELIPEALKSRFDLDTKKFEEALKFNTVERSRRFNTLKTKSIDPLVKRVRTRSYSLFEPRPELNHATNSVCVVGRRALTRGLFLDRRAFLNSYDYRKDEDGTFLLGIMNAIAPVCGGINLEYYFSRVDNNNLGAGTKLPHNVMGLIGVANGIDGDLRTGLPSQMIEVHDPIRLLTVVEHNPEVVLEVIKRNPMTYEWFKNEWIVLVVYDPLKQIFLKFQDEMFVPYVPLQLETPKASLDLNNLIHQAENQPIQIINNLSI